MSSPTALPADAKQPITLDELSERGLVVAGRLVELVVAKSANGTFRLNLDAKPKKPTKPLTPKESEMAAGIVAYLATQDGSVKRRTLETKFMDGHRGGALQTVIDYLKARGELYSEHGMYADSAEKLEA